eukprot:NODE_7818_length_1548_cov_4.097818.p1 GENE.NODE_7818_length_1548_cov_4.097818~~NODE_7818_length_1548_cov_4.097818.p1  ORF type:complete len:412 (-),score=56.38 NODE_7818_length_1548_cov_4.097818:210-1445(-)
MPSGALVDLYTSYGRIMEATLSGLREDSSTNEIADEIGIRWHAAVESEVARIKHHHHPAFDAPPSRHVGGQLAPAQQPFHAGRVMPKTLERGATVHYRPMRGVRFAEPFVAPGSLCASQNPAALQLSGFAASQMGELGDDGNGGAVQPPSLPHRSTVPIVPSVLLPPWKRARETAAPWSVGVGPPPAEADERLPGVTGQSTIGPAGAIALKAAVPVPVPALELPSSPAERRPRRLPAKGALPVIEAEQPLTVAVEEVPPTPGAPHKAVTEATEGGAVDSDSDEFDGWLEDAEVILAAGSPARPFAGAASEGSSATLQPPASILPDAASAEHDVNDTDDSEFDEPEESGDVFLADNATIRMDARNWFVTLKEGILIVDGMEYLFSTAEGHLALFSKCSEPRGRTRAAEQLAC